MNFSPAKAEDLKAAAIGHNRIFQAEFFMQSARFFYFFHFARYKQMKSVGYGQFRRCQAMLFFVQRFYRSVCGDKSESWCQNIPMTCLDHPRPRPSQFIFYLEKHFICLDIECPRDFNFYRQFLII